MIKERIGRELYLARCANYLGLDTAATMIRRTRSALKRWEDGTNTPDLDELDDLCTKLNHRFVCEIVPEDEARSREMVAAIVSAAPEREREDFGALLLRIGASLVTTRHADREALTNRIVQLIPMLARSGESDRLICEALPDAQAAGLTRVLTAVRSLPGNQRAAFMADMGRLAVRLAGMPETQRAAVVSGA